VQSQHGAERAAVHGDVLPQPLTQKLHQRVRPLGRVPVLHCQLGARAVHLGRDVIDEAEEAVIPILATRLTLYDACGTLFKAGLPGGTGRKL